MIGSLARALLLVTAVAAHDMLPVNPELGVCTPFVSGRR